MQIDRERLVLVCAGALTGSAARHRADLRAVMTGKKLIKIKSIFFADRGRTDVQTALSGINSIAGDVKASTARRLPA